MWRADGEYTSWWAAIKVGVFALWVLVTPWIIGGFDPSCGLFSLGFCRQGLFGPLTKCPGVEPIDPRDWEIFGFGFQSGHFGVLSAFSSLHTQIVLFDSDFCHVDPVSREVDLRLWCVRALCSLAPSPHKKRTCRDLDHFDASDRLRVGDLRVLLGRLFVVCFLVVCLFV